ncbi:MAG: MerC domain-containing protein [Chitinophagaceae bacterium]|nr:MerC domain-containing protein [Chitinophagaceae bacterium]MBL0337147.1 MerC domain-containing protein [Chitinophagaceae bacterium]
MHSRINWDAMGIGASLACAIHCAVLPLITSSLPLFGINIIHNVYFEAGMIVLAFFIGSSALFHGYRKHHHRILPIALFTAGISLLVIKQFFHAWEIWFLIPGALGIITAHLLNFRFCRVHNHAHQDDCNH